MKSKKTAGGNVARAAMDIGSKESVDIPTLGRLIFGPLNKYTYRFGWRQRALESEQLIYWRSRDGSKNIR